MIITSANGTSASEQLYFIQTLPCRISLSKYKNLFQFSVSFQHSYWVKSFPMEVSKRAPDFHGKWFWRLMIWRLTSTHDINPFFREEEKFLFKILPFNVGVAIAFLVYR